MIYRTQRQFFQKAYQSGEHGWPITGAEPAFKKYLKKVQKAFPGGSVLDIGCGEGRNSIFAASLGFDVCGMDYAELALFRAKDFLKKEKSHVHLLSGDIFRAPLKNNTFHAVLDYGCFHHVLKKHWNLYIHQVVTLLKPRGFFLLAVFSTKFKHEPDERRKRNYLLHRGHYDHFFTKRELKRAFAEAFDFIDLQEETSGLESFLFALLRKV